MHNYFRHRNPVANGALKIASNFSASKNSIPACGRRGNGAPSLILESFGRLVPAPCNAAQHQFVNGPATRRCASACFGNQIMTLSTSRTSAQPGRRPVPASAGNHPSAPPILEGDPGRNGGWRGGRHRHGLLLSIINTSLNAPASPPACWPLRSWPSSAGRAIDRRRRQ